MILTLQDLCRVECVVVIHAMSGGDRVFVHLAVHLLFRTVVFRIVDQSMSAKKGRALGAEEDCASGEWLLPWWGAADQRPSRDG